MTKTINTTSAAESEKTGEASKTAVGTPQKRPVAVLFVLTGSSRMQFTFPMENAKAMPVPVRNFIEAFESGSERLLWRPAPNAPVALVPARCVGWEVRTGTLTSAERKADAGRAQAANEAGAAEEKPAGQA